MTHPAVPCTSYPGLLNMDTGDPSGDIGFGMWEIMMPMDCRGGSRHMNIGCGGTTAGNGTGKYIKPGDPTNVYEQFVVEVNSLYGECELAPTNVRAQFIVVACSSMWRLRTRAARMMGGSAVADNDCNPVLEGPQAGMFTCEASDDGTHCACAGHTAVKWEEWDDDCLNGTVYSAQAINASACRAACVSRTASCIARGG